MFRAQQRSIHVGLSPGASVFFYRHKLDLDSGLRRNVSNTEQPDRHVDGPPGGRAGGTRSLFIGSFLNAENYYVFDAMAYVQSMITVKPSPSEILTFTFALKFFFKDRNSMVSSVATVCMWEWTA